MTLYEEHIAKVQEWLEKTASANAELSGERDWCILDIDTSITEEKLSDYFDRADLGKKYAEEYGKNTDAGQPFAYLQTDSDLIFSLHKCFAARHRGRLMNYRDDCAQKNYHTYSAISMGLAGYQSAKEDAEKVA